MLFKILKRMIEKGNIEGITEKLDVFFASGKISQEEYTELTEMLSKADA